MATVSSVPEAAQRFLQGSAKGLWIDNAYVDASGDATITAYNPADGSELGVVQEASAADVDAAVKSSRAAFEGEWSALTPDDRGRLLWKIAELVEENLEELATLETLNNGKPIVAARRDDIPNIAAMFRYYAGWTTKITGQTIPVSAGNFLAYTRREPVGVTRRDHPLELPADDGRLEARAGARVRQHDDHQAGGADAALDAAAGRDLRRGGPARRASSTCSTAWARPRARPSSSTRASTRSRSPARPRSAA